MNETGCGAVGKCSVPMFCQDMPAGHCDRPAYGKQYVGRQRTLVRLPYAPGLACDWHGGPDASGIRFERDGNAWCAFMPGFTNLQESTAGFGATQDEAEDDLLRQMKEAA